MIEDDTRILRNRLDEKTLDIQNLTNTQLEMMNQAIVTNKELMTNDLEIATVKMQNEQLQNELKAKKELTERMKESSEVVRYFEDFLRSPKGISDTSRLGYAEKGESSSNREMKNTKGKTTCHHYGKIRHKTNICRSKNGSHNPKQSTKGKNQKEGH